MRDASFAGCRTWAEAEQFQSPQGVRDASGNRFCKNERRTQFQSPQGVRDASTIHEEKHIQDLSFNPRKGCEMHPDNVFEVYCREYEFQSPQGVRDASQKLLGLYTYTLLVFQSPQGVRDASISKHSLRILEYKFQSPQGVRDASHSSVVWEPSTFQSPQGVRDASVL